MSTNVAVYGQIDMNLLDGSSIWLQSVALTLAEIPGVRPVVLLRTPPSRQLLIEPLLARPEVTVIDPSTRRAGVRRLEPADAVALLAELDDEFHLSRVLLRGGAVMDAAVADGRFDGRLWYYYVPPHGDGATSDAEALRRRLAVCDRVLCQTDTIATRVVAAVPGSEDRILSLPPMIPGPLTERRAPEGPLQRLFYGGKFSPEYSFLEMVSLFAEVRNELPGLVWDVAGDKIHNPPAQPDFRTEAERALRTTAGLVWHGAISRARVRELLLDADVALSLRHHDMDRSTELSTKVLEYGAAGCPALLNRNPVHTALLGSDYPLLAGDLEEARLRLLAANADPALRAEAQRRCFEAASRHTFDRVALILASHLPKPAEAGRPTPAQTGSPRLVLAGHEVKFFAAIRDRAVAAGAAVREDRWRTHGAHDEAASMRALEWAQVIHCEWCLGAAVWYSRRRRDDQRLVVRFHRQELETPYPAQVDLDRVDAMVFVSRHILEAACEQFGWAADHPSLRVVENAVDCARLAREKLPGSEFALALVGWVPMRKRLDRALDILERVRGHDERFRLIVKGAPPWDYDWMATRAAERRYYEAALARIERSPLLGSAVTFEPFGEDIATFLEKVGWVLSVSNGEGHAVAPAEGMASGAIPVVIDRPGACQQYPEPWIHADAEAAAKGILDVTHTGGVGRERATAREVAAKIDWPQIAPVWDALLTLEPS